MSNDWKDLERAIRELPPELQREVEAFVSRLATVGGGDQREDGALTPTFGWAGALKGEDKTSVEPQHEITRQWTSRP